MTGDIMSAEEAYALGLVNRVVEQGEELSESIALARRLAGGAPYAVQSTKVAVNKYIKMVSNLVLPVSLALEEISMTKEDHQEAIRAFQEKREPRFTGR
jgi:enoyl-CoA hydratase